MATGTTTNKCKCCKYTCNACPGGTKKLPPSFTVTLSGVAFATYGYDVLNKTWTVAYDATIAKWIYQTSNPPFAVPYDWIFSSSGAGSYSGYEFGDPTGVDSGDIVTINCYTDSVGVKKLRLFAGVFDSEPVGIPPFVSYWRRCRWVVYEFAIDGTNTCSPLFIQQTSSVNLLYNDANPGFGPVQISTQSPTLTIAP